ncbi:MAG: ATP-grasp domain-containing protein [Candidatus Gygaella obscura]|nr:ATP-grasp domain-containing protein [Candidatus Gygaella obscura]
MIKKIGLTFDLKTDYKPNQDDPQDIVAEFDSERTIGEISSALEANGFKVERIGNAKNLIKRLPDLGVDLVLNIAEGYKGRNRESQVPLLLEMYDVPFIGADALTLGLTLDKLLAKKIFVAEGIPTPKFFEVDSVDELERISDYNFPLFVKPRYEGSSKGLSEASRVTDIEGLRRQVELITQVYKQSVLVEEFIKGREFTVAIIGNNPPEVFPSVQVEIDNEINLGDKFYTFARITSDRLKYVCPAKISENLENELRQLALRVYKAVDCRDFGRVDFRVDDNDKPFVLEINPLPILSHEDTFMIVAEYTKIGYNGIIKKIVDAAIKRLNLNKKGE